LRMMKEIAEKLQTSVIAPEGNKTLNLVKLSSSPIRSISWELSVAPD
jgi:hypothetical protein